MDPRDRPSRLGGMPVNTMGPQVGPLTERSPVTGLHWERLDYRKAGMFLHVTAKTVCF